MDSLLAHPHQSLLDVKTNFVQSLVGAPIMVIQEHAAPISELAPDNRKDGRNHARLIVRRAGEP